MIRSDRFALATLLPLLALSVLMHVLAQGNDDKAWLLLAARMWLMGKKLYVDVVEVNPPLIIWFYSLPVMLSRHLSSLSDYQTLGLLGVVAGTCVIALCLALIRFHPMFESSPRARAEFLLLLAFIFIFLVPQNYFFDREPILYLFTFPYVLRFMPGLAQSRVPLSLRVAAGWLAALGFCIKPHTAIVFLGVQLLLLIRGRTVAILFNLENAIVCFGVGVYLLCVWHFTPEYVHTILPMALESYSTFSRGGSTLLCLPPVILCAGLIFADFRLRYTSPYRSDIFYYVGIAVLWLVYALVGNGWDYTYYPLTATLMLLAGLVLSEYRWLRAEVTSSDKQFSFGMRGCAICLATQGIYMTLVTFTSVNVAVIQAKCNNNWECLRQDPYLAYFHDKNIRSFGTISQDFPKWVEAVRFTGADWETRFNHLWMLPQLLKEREHPVPEHVWMRTYLEEALAEDLNRNSPEVVFVDTAKQYSIYPDYVDLVGYLSVSATFRAAWSRYRYEATINECDKVIFKNACRYDIYRLKDKAGP